jgi:hypothetical protein
MALQGEASKPLLEGRRSWFVCTPTFAMELTTSFVIANYELLCVVSANLSKLPIELKREHGKKVYRLDLELVLKFGLTELEAQIAWKEKVCVLISDL